MDPKKYVCIEGVDIVTIVIPRVYVNGRPTGDQHFEQVGLSLKTLKQPGGLLSGETDWDNVTHKFEGQECQLYLLDDEAKMVAHIESVQEDLDQFPDCSVTILEEDTEELAGHMDNLNYSRACCQHRQEYLYNLDIAFKEQAVGLNPDFQPYVPLPVEEEEE